MRFLIIFLMLLGLLSCGENKEVEISRSRGFRVTHYSISGETNWIKVSGLAIFRTNYSFDEEAESTYVKWNFKDYRDQFGNCNGIIESTATEGSMNDVYDSNPPMGDVNDPYDPEGSDYKFSDSASQSVLKTTTVKIETSNCPFVNFAENYYALFFFSNGQLYITDKLRGLDFRLIPY